MISAPGLNNYQVYKWNTWMKNQCEPNKLACLGLLKLDGVRKKCSSLLNSSVLQ